MEKQVNKTEWMDAFDQLSTVSCQYSGSLFSSVCCQFILLSFLRHLIFIGLLNTVCVLLLSVLCLHYVEIFLLLCSVASLHVSVQ